MIFDLNQSTLIGTKEGFEVARPRSTSLMLDCSVVWPKCNVMHNFPNRVLNVMISNFNSAICIGEKAN